MTRTLLAIAALALVLVAAVRCKRANGAYCDDTRPCPSGFACDVAERECHVTALGGADLAGVAGDLGCSCAGSAPICVASQCVSCLSTSDPDAACAAVSPSTPHCLSGGSDAGSCVGCRDGNDCGGNTPFCDAAAHVCRGCIADSECSSLVCDLTPASPTHGLCVDAGSVAYADPAGPDGDGKTAATAKHKIQDAVNVAVGLNPARLYVHVAAGTYNESVGVNNKTIYLVGADGAIVHPTNGDAIGAQNNGSMTVRNIIATATSGNAGNCQTNASLTAYRSQFINSSQLGIYNVACTLVVDGCWIHGNAGGGFSLSGGNFTIINSIITKNTGAGGVQQVTAGTNMLFANNTVADNTSSVTANAGINCAAVGVFAPVNSIFFNNKLGGGAIAETNCAGSFNADDDISAGPQSTVDLTMQPPGFKGGVPLTPDSYHLAPTSPCISEASPLSSPDHDFDFEPRPDKRTGKPDIGADEVQ